jgi:hypothetical protein
MTTASKSRTAENTTVSELFKTVAPPREGTTGAHVVSVGPNYMIVIQGPEALHLTRRVLDYIEKLSEQANVSSE